ncbi:ABC transporter substrate-binding protein [Pseudodesulfovibrio methanolicus]|uniref:ABC transporter substrate-binding protein n=1 Tax=Pseudodesulfovibrio methanolicus TaxID=3126690 RepID=A0ABZ2ISB2_9BACT
MDGRVAWISYLSVAALLMLTAVPSLAAQKRILLIQSYDPSLPWTGQCERGIRSALPESVALDITYLDTKRRTPAEYRANVDEAMARFQRTRPDLVMLGDDNALRILGPAIADTGVPVVYFGINNNPRSYFRSLPPNVVGVIERIPLFHWVRVLTGVVPDARNILVLMDDSPTAKAIFDTNFMGRQSVAFDGRTVRCALIDEWARWRETVLANGYDFILMPIYHALKDRNGEHVDYKTVVAWTSEHGTAPVFATQDYAVGDQGVVGALVLVGEEHGAIAGRLAAGILRGQDIADLSALDDQQGRMFFNRKQLARFGLVLPPDLAERAVFR